MWTWMRIKLCQTFERQKWKYKSTAVNFISLYPHPPLHHVVCFDTFFQIIQKNIQCEMWRTIENFQLLRHIIKNKLQPCISNILIFRKAMLSFWRSSLYIHWQSNIWVWHSASLSNSSRQTWVVENTVLWLHTSMTHVMEHVEENRDVMILSFSNLGVSEV